MRSPILLRPNDGENDEKYALFGYLFDTAPVDHMVHRLLYTTYAGERALGTIARDGHGHMEVWRITPGSVASSNQLHNWLEVSVFLDLFAPIQEGWVRDPDEEERRRQIDRDIELRGGRGRGVTR